MDVYSEKLLPSGQVLFNYKNKILCSDIENHVDVFLKYSDYYIFYSSFYASIIPKTEPVFKSLPSFEEKKY